MLVLTLLFAFVTTSIHSQSTCNQDETECGSAYAEGSYTAHWSVYVPIAIIVVAAIGFTISDKSHHSSDYSDSQDGLGSIENSKRNSHNRSSSYSASSYSRSGYSH